MRSPWTVIVRSPRGVEVREGAPLRHRARGREHGEPVAPGQLVARAARELVVAERADERRVAGQAGHLHRGDRAAARGRAEGLARDGDLARHREAVDDGEVDPLDVADDARAAHRARTSAEPLSRSQRCGSR